MRLSPKRRYPCLEGLRRLQPPFTMLSQRVPDHIAQFAVRHCFDAPTPQDIQQLVPAQSAILKGLCAQTFYPYADGCTHTLCGNGASADPSVLRLESQGISWRILKEHLASEGASFCVEICPTHRSWQISWRGGQGVHMVNEKLERTILSAVPWRVYLSRTPLAREVRGAVRRLSRYLGVPLPSWNDYVRDDLTHEYPVRFGPWSDAVLDGTELQEWVHDLANGLCTRPMIRETDVLELLASSVSEHREIGLLLMAAKSYQRRTP